MQRFIRLSFAAMAMVISLLTFTCDAQTTHLRGLVRDSLTHQPVPYAAVFLRGSDRGALTGDDGRFDIVTGKNFSLVEVSAMGYRSKSVPARRGVTSDIVIDLKPVGVELDEVVIRPRKEKYSKKNNPAVDFMNRIRHTASLNDPRRHDNYNYRKYERITIALNNFRPDDSKNLMLKKFDFLKEHVDTSEVSGKPILNVSTKEKSSEIHYRNTPRSEREIVTGTRRVGMDDITDEESLQAFYEDVLREIDIYSNDVNILQNRFVSPLSRLAADFYKFYLADTVMMGGERCVELTFVPRNPQSFGFTGRMYVPLGDSTMFVKKVLLNVPHDINLNFIDHAYIEQEYERAPDGSRLKTRDDMTLELSLLPGAQGIYVRRNTAYADHNFDEFSDQSIFGSLAPVLVDKKASARDEEFWQDNRLIPISDNERKVDRLMTRLRSVPLYYWSEKVLKILVSGYIHTADPSKIDIGPMNTTISGNDVEGLRLRAGGMTTANLSPRWFGRGYVAYGTKDHRWKYKVEAEYSFRDKKYHSREFPVHSLRLTQLYDVDMLGQHYMFTNPDNMFLSLKRQKDTQMTYHHVSKLEYTLELENNFSVEASIARERQEATAYMPFTDGLGRSFGHYDETSFTVQLRYAPGEKFYQTKSYRIPINLDAPVFVLSHTVAPARAFGNMFAINRTEASIQKRFWFSAFGYTDIILKGGHVWSRSPYPNLLIPNANLSYTIQPESYALMNPLEFINDSYASWDITYWANGAIFNAIPYFRRLKLREAFSCRGLFGHLSDRNNPACDENLFRFPGDAHTRLMTHTPYVEAGVGVDNLFKVLRVDYVWRLTYRDLPGIDRSGVRIALHFTF